MGLGLSTRFPQLRCARVARARCFACRPEPKNVTSLCPWCCTGQMFGIEGSEDPSGTRCDGKSIAGDEHTSLCRNKHHEQVQREELNIFA